jgi:hypothetical protein
LDFLSFDTAIGYIAAFSGLTFAISLFMHPNRERQHVSFAIVMILLSFGLGIRSYYWETGDPIYMSASYFFLSLFPLCFTLFVERFLQKQLSSYFKIAVLLSLAFFALTCWAYPLRHTPVWKMAYMFYHVGSIAFLLIALFRYKSKSILRRQERHVYNALFYCTLLSLGLLILEWLYAIGPMRGQHVRLSPFGMIIFIHSLSQIYFNENEFSFISEIKNLMAYAIFSLFSTGILFLGGAAILNQSQLLSTIGLIFTCAVSFSALYAQALMASGRGLSERIFQIIDVSKDSVPQFLKDLMIIPEFKRVGIATAADIEDLECEESYRILQEGRVVTRNTIRRRLRYKGLSFREKNALEATLYLLQTKGVTAGIAIGATRNVLLATPVAMRSLKHFEGILIWAAQNLNFLYQQQPLVDKPTEEIFSPDIYLDSSSEVQR